MSDGPLDRLREAGVRVELEGGQLRAGPRRKLTGELRRILREREAEIRRRLLQEAATRELGLVPVDPATGDPDLSATEPAAADQVDRLRELARHPDGHPDARAVVDRAVEKGLSEAGAYVLIGRLGRYIARAGNEDEGGGGLCRDCGRRIGPTSTRCGSCKRTRREAGT